MPQANNSRLFEKKAESKHRPDYWKVVVAALEKLQLLAPETADIAENLALCHIKAIKDPSSYNKARIEQLLEDIATSGNADKAQELRELLASRIRELTPKLKKPWWKKK